MRYRLLALVIALGVATAAPSAAPAATLQPIGTFDQPVYVTSLPDPDRLLVVEQPGRILHVQAGTATTFLDIRGMVATVGEQGLLSVAVAPDYSTTGHIYVFYTRAGDGALQIDEFTASGSAVPISSRRPVLTIPHPIQTNHNGGQLQFGPDGYLYIATGDGGGGGDPQENAQNLNSLLGKVLRVDPRRAGTAPYSVPADNPFGTPVWALGLRNPWRFSFDAGTGDLLIGDVGQGAREEIDYAPRSSGGGRGLNFGWNCREGLIAYSGAPPSCVGRTGFTDPMFDYPTHVGGTCAVTGGYVVRDTSLPDLYGRYVYADFCVGQIRSLIPALPRATDDRSEGLTVANPSSFGEDSCRRIYVASRSTGVVLRLVGSSPAVCPQPGTTTPPPTGRETCAGRAVTATPGTNGKVTGTPKRDVIAGDASANRIRAGAGNDLICAAAGNDVIKAGPGSDRIKAGPGRDKMRGGPGNDRCTGGPGKDRERSC